MEAKHSLYNFNDSITRVDEILGGNDSSYENRKNINL